MCVQPSGDAARRFRRRHADVIAEYHAGKLQRAAQVVDPETRISRRLRIHARIGDMRHHHRFGAGGNAGAERQQVFGFERRQLARIERCIEMRVFQHRAVAGKMLERGRHACRVHALHVSGAQIRHDARCQMEGALADGAIAALQVHHRRETQIQPDGADFRRHQPGMRARRLQRTRGIGIKARTQARQLRQGTEPFAEPLHRPAFLIHAQNQRPRRGRTQLRAKFGNLFARGEVAGEKNDAAHARMRQPIALLGFELRSGNTDHEHG